MSVGGKEVKTLITKSLMQILSHTFHSFCQYCMRDSSALEKHSKSGSCLAMAHDYLAQKQTNKQGTNKQNIFLFPLLRLVL